MSELPVGTTFREAIRLASAAPTESNTRFERQRIEIGGKFYYKYIEVPCTFTRPNIELDIPGVLNPPFTRSNTATFINKFFIKEGNQ